MDDCKHPSVTECWAVTDADRIVFMRAEQLEPVIIWNDDYSGGRLSEERTARAVDVLIAEPFSMREDRAVEVARAVLKAALER